MNYLDNYGTCSSPRVEMSLEDPEHLVLTHLSDTVLWLTTFYPFEYVFYLFLQIMIYLIDKVLPESYFVNNLRALSVDMAVFRDLLRLKLPELSEHLDTLQRTANKESGGSGDSMLLYLRNCLLL